MTIAWLSAWALALLALNGALHTLQQRAPAWTVAGLRLALHLGLPIAALANGILGTADFGLGRWMIDAHHWMGFSLDAWLRGIGAMTLALTVSLMVVLLVRATTDRRVADGDGVLLSVEALCDELRWSFYRAVLVAAMGDSYAGAALALALVLLEWWLYRRWRLGQHSVDSGQALPRAWCLAMSTSLYLATQNLWLGMVAHVTLRSISHAWLNRSTTAAPPGASLR